MQKVSDLRLYGGGSGHSVRAGGRVQGVPVHHLVRIFDDVLHTVHRHTMAAGPGPFAGGTLIMLTVGITALTCRTTLQENPAP